MDSLIGKTIDNYSILEVIGRGGMGVVFKALDTNLEKIVALKMIDPFLARDESFVRRFKTEAKALAKLENPNIVGVYALRETDSGFFMVMEFVDSKPLSQYLFDNGPFNIKETIAITRQLLNAIGHAHKAGIIHRDIKPSNILLCYDGKIKVTDFGLAKVVQQKGPASTVTQARAGTLYYMSPEQVKGLKNVDIRSDLYSLGMTVYEMIAGRVPFEKTASDFTIQKQIVDGEIPSPVKFNSSIPKKLTKIISKSINKEPDKRYQSADEMLKDLEIFEKEFSEGQKKDKSPAKLKSPKIPDPNKDKLSKIGPNFSFIKKPVFLISSSVLILILIVLYFLLTPSNPLLYITTEPEKASVNINKNEVGNSPVEYLLESEGNVRIEINKEGFTSIDTSLDLTIGEKKTLNFHLIPLAKEEIQIATDPVGAKLIINSMFAGNSPLNNFAIVPGKHEIRVEKASYLSLDTTINVIKDRSEPFLFTLQKDPDFKGFGVLKINSNPKGVSVILNGENLGKTPYENKELPVGEYNLILRESGYSDYNESIKITLNKTTTISKQLSSEISASADQFGQIKVSTKPESASVYLNGEYIGSTPYENQKVPIGTHRLVIKKSGFSEVNENIKIESDKLTPISKNLIVAGKLTVSSEPAGADVLIDEKKVGKTPYTNSNLSLGEYTVTVTKSGFKPYIEKIKIADSKSSFSIKPKLEILTGKIEILVFPYGDIYIDNDKKAENTTSRYITPLSGGKHIIRIEHPTLGSLTKEINIISEKPQRYDFNLERVLKLKVVSEPTNCEIFINDEPSQKYTPFQISLKPGTYKIQVSKEGFISVPDQKIYNVSSDIYEESEDRNEKIMFELKKNQ